MTVGIDLGPAVALLSFDTVAVTRVTTQYNEHGVLVPTQHVDDMTLELVDDEPTTLSVVCSVQPTAGKDLDRLTEEQRTRGSITVFSQDKLQISTAPGVQSDYITWRDERYDVVGSAQWDSAGYWRTVLVKAVP